MQPTATQIPITEPVLVSKYWINTSPQWILDDSINEQSEWAIRSMHDIGCKFHATIVWHKRKILELDIKYNDGIFRVCRDERLTSALVADAVCIANWYYPIVFRFGISAFGHVDQGSIQQAGLQSVPWHEYHDALTGAGFGVTNVHDDGWRTLRFNASTLRPITPMFYSKTGSVIASCGKNGSFAV